jgi:hypothetical protein
MATCFRRDGEAPPPCPPPDIAYRRSKGGRGGGWTKFLPLLSPMDRASLGRAFCLRRCGCAVVQGGRRGAIVTIERLPLPALPLTSLSARQRWVWGRVDKFLALAQPDGSGFARAGFCLRRIGLAARRGWVVWSLNSFRRLRRWRLLSGVLWTFCLLGLWCPLPCPSPAAWLCDGAGAGGGRG